MVAVKTDKGFKRTNKEKHINIISRSGKGSESRMSISWQRKKRWKEISKTIGLGILSGLVVAAAYIIVTAAINLRSEREAAIGWEDLSNTWQQSYNDIADEYQGYVDQSIIDTRDERRRYLDLAELSLGIKEGLKVWTGTGYSGNDTSQGTSMTTSSGVTLYGPLSEIIVLVAGPPELKIGTVLRIQAIWDRKNSGVTTERLGLVIDRGGKIIGDRLDFYFEDKQDAIDFGVQGVLVQVFDPGEWGINEY